MADEGAVDLGEHIRRQRGLHELSMRHAATFRGAA